MRYFRGSLLFTILCLFLAGWLGWSLTGTISGVLSTLWIALVLGVLEISLSFDNAIVNATVLRGLDPVWRRRFLIWGILIAVVGMRILFPLMIVAIAAHIGPLDALFLAILEPRHYEQIITDVHITISGFGGAFLAMVSLKFFFDSSKRVHWIGLFEKRLARLGDLDAITHTIVLLALYAVSRLLAPEDAAELIVAGIFGLVTFVGVEVIGNVLGGPGGRTGEVARVGLSGFLYLEVLDASFSFDGVVGAFALTNNLFVIALGLGIGAMFVRSMTVMLVDRGTLSEYRYLEHGAFYAILALAGVMLLSARYDIPEVVTGLISACLIGLSLLGSILYNRKRSAIEPPPTQ
ncbi:DUF475 domain-containing protein [Beijerinckia indica]|uniref:Integral membrane protein TerC n=1 Tax=Beijerinckia indica subsp. indica (strain ATCC 9039 / DSM 1715 / NCIMB 8712) TaxID=395963 RepID=B2ICL1_BEII9|nr:DUF475 domain-containing protein [Beijerinckia indica]ACB93900.1 protein of unknown function DUF475 [Beijerinckia indica subsp. indica ATCC 9039]